MTGRPFGLIWLTFGFMELTDDDLPQEKWFLILKHTLLEKKEAKGLKGTEFNLTFRKGSGKKSETLKFSTEHRTELLTEALVRIVSC